MRKGGEGLSAGLTIVRTLSGGLEKDHSVLEGSFGLKRRMRMCVAYLSYSVMDDKSMVQDFPKMMLVLGFLKG